MMELQPGHRVDGFVIDARIHAGGMANIYSVRCANPAAQRDVPLIMKVPHLGAGAENLVGFEVEKQILSALHGPHVPRFVAAGDAVTQPYLVMEHVEGSTLQQWLDASPPRDPAAIARLGACIAEAVSALHRQQACHLDLKPANVILRGDGTAVLIDFGLSHHARFPDLMAEEGRVAGSHIWIAPEQIAGVRGDPRSDIFAIGVMLYEMCTGELPFGDPRTPSGLRQRLWKQPVPPRQLDAGIPDWLQEIVLRCLEAHADDRYASADRLAFDLRHPEQVKIGARGSAVRGAGFWRQLQRWRAERRTPYRPSPVPHVEIAPLPIVMVAIPHDDVRETTLEALRQAVTRGLGNRPGARLSCVTVIPPAGFNEAGQSEVVPHQRMLAYLREWAGKLVLGDHLATYHVLESDDVAGALLSYAEGNEVNLIIMGAATHGLQLQRFIATVPIRVAMHAPCTVMLVKA